MSAVDLSSLPAPQIIDVPDFEALLTARKARLVSLYPAELQEAVARALELESEPQLKILQENCYREILLRQRINEAVQAVIIARSGGVDLDNLVANFNVQRLVVTPADETAVPPVPAVMESDEDLRQRAPEAFEGLSVAGPEAAYNFHARSADGRVADASTVSPSPAAVVVTVLSHEGNGQASQALLDIVASKLSAETIRPLGDRLTVQSAAITEYRVAAKLHLFDGVVAGPCLAAAKNNLAAYLLEQKKLARSIRRDNYKAVLRVAGVDWVELLEPAADVLMDKSQSGYCTATDITIAGDAND
ncbi:baseplate J/gp47 family protein [Atlantibacter hermannii]|uniref:baseplate J/gp47 family protein n=1 Tax=Atlantibacter hermannii TaxID=565 RepID=UPI00296EB3AF|nr:baseplate J/gp47 family protein [Atlantibacter hermannii]MDW4578394.1 baseplate J/gp47 family protein [Atlantibacter hermannii]